MKIRKIKFKEHPVLGNLKLDFTYKDEAGNEKVYDNIIFAGENGTGKTTILKELSILSEFRGIIHPSHRFEYINYKINTCEDIKLFIKKEIWHAQKNNYIYLEQKLPDSERLLKSNFILSEARSDFPEEAITTVTSKQTDDSGLNIGENKFTDIKQLLVDIYYEDNYIFREKSRVTPISEKDFKKYSKIHRFKNAFNFLFKEKKIFFDRIENNHNQKNILFLKNGEEKNIDELSSGEKQIISRGAFLIRDIGVLDNSFIMIDEPELNMHPLWQRKILDYYTGLFKDENEEQIAQMFFATHSNHVLETAIEKEDCGILILSEKDGNIESTNIKHDEDKGEMLLPTTTSAELNYHAFNLSTFEYHNQLYGEFLSRHGETNGNLKKIDNCIKSFIKKNKIEEKLLLKKSSTGKWFCKKNKKRFEYLPTFIRNKTHHPDNKDRSDYKEEELKRSIELLRKMLSIGLNKESCDNCKKLEEARKKTKSKKIRK